MNGMYQPPPTVSVILPVYNAIGTVAAAVYSILNQSLRELELIVVDDGSTDGSGQMLSGLLDDRLKVMNHCRNLGISRSLNLGMEAARGKYVARMDADDVAHTERFERQVAFLEANSDVGLCGSSVCASGAGTSSIWRHPLKHEEIRILLLFENPIFHPTVMFRRALLTRIGLAYEPGWDGAEDYRLWARLADKVVMANLDEPLVTYRRSSNGDAEIHRCRLADRVRLQQLQGLGLDVSPAQLALHSKIGRGSFDEIDGQIEEVERWLNHLVAANDQACKYDPRLFRECIGRRYFRICRSLSISDRSALRRFKRSPFVREANIPMWQRSEAHLRQWWFALTKKMAGACR